MAIPRSSGRSKTGITGNEAMQLGSIYGYVSVFDKLNSFFGSTRACPPGYLNTECMLSTDIMILATRTTRSLTLQQTMHSI